jgi:hypothetical protein
MLSGLLNQLDVGASPSPSGPAALVLHYEEGSDCLVVFVTDGPRRPAIATFARCSQSIFGYPNDEAYWGVPGAGYGFYEVVESDWAERVAEFNRLRFPGTGVRTEARHFFMGCHDSSGQFLADDLRVEVFDREYHAVVQEALTRLIVDDPM